jgi:hypothetical protein
VLRAGQLLEDGFEYRHRLLSPGSQQSPVPDYRVAPPACSKALASCRTRPS